MENVLRERFENHDLFMEGLPGRLGRLENTWGRVRGNSSKETLKELAMFEVQNARPLSEIPAF